MSSPEKSRDRRRSSREDDSDVDSRGKYSRRRQRSRSRSSEADDGERKRGGERSRRGYGDDAERGERRRRHRRPDRSVSDGEDDRKHPRRHRDRGYRDRSRSRERSHRHRRSRSPHEKKRKSASKSRSPPPAKRSKAPLPSQNESYRAELGPGDEKPPPEKQKPNFKPTGLLAKEANTVAGTSTVLKYHEPPEARKPPPPEAWRFYVFKGRDMLDTVNLFHRSAWLVGKDQKVTDYLIDHPSVSKQHAVIQFRHRTSKNEFGDVTSKVKPYLIDLESANGTHLNGKKIEASRYVELVDQDVVKFGDSEREYVVMLPPPEK